MLIAIVSLLLIQAAPTATAPSAEPVIQCRTARDPDTPEGAAVFIRVCGPVEPKPEPKPGDPGLALSDGGAGSLHIDSPEGLAEPVAEAETDRRCRREETHSEDGTQHSVQVLCGDRGASEDLVRDMLRF